MLGQFRKCVFCKRRFRLTKGLGLFGGYEFVTMINRNDGTYNYCHKKCLENYKRTKLPNTIQRLMAGFNLKEGIFIRGEVERSD